MTTSRLYASKKFMGALLLMMGFVLPANAAVFTYFIFYGRYSLSYAVESGFGTDISGYFIFRQLVR